ncbi:REP-associated tyrosine transposase [Bradyrhizobium sp.]|jgi:putative transposase|uniref:REP-associated tyrosine transposase n=1 Tax=Bradyrhizobium sp. TaxID=376 RepID=UPI002DDD595E|nr:transposase [Bradyrhizobium sp.]HEV2158928.1 transposase [Bradyrhizobium sp.]
MVLYRRNFLPGDTYFFTVALFDRRSSLLIENVDVLRNAFRAARKERPFEIDAVVILPDHLHVLLKLPLDDADFAGRWRRINGSFSSALLHAGVEIARHSNGELALWQRRYWEHTIRDEDDFARHVDYIHFNPVKHGYLRRVGDWPYSSFHRYVWTAVLPKDWAGDAGESGDAFGERAEEA